jgi:hypothetical protein
MPSGATRPERVMKTTVHRRHWPAGALALSRTCETPDRSTLLRIQLCITYTIIATRKYFLASELIVVFPFYK